MPASSPCGTPVSAVELTNVSAHGFWLLVDGHEWFLAFEHFPWFANTTIRQLAEVVQVAPDHLRWPALDIDISFESIRHPERHPLVSRIPAAVREGGGKPPAAKPLWAVEAAALGLPADERACLVERLLDSLHGGAGDSVERLTLGELEARADDASQGSRDWTVVRERLRRMLDP